MPSLMINLVTVNNIKTWRAMVSGTNVVYDFTGASAPEQEAFVQQLAVAMQEGVNAIDASIAEVFALPQGIAPATVSAQLFGVTDQVQFMEKQIAGCIGDEVLIEDEDVLETAGQVIMAFFA